MFVGQSIHKLLNYNLYFIITIPNFLKRFDLHKKFKYVKNIVNMCLALLAYYYRIYLYHTLTVIVVPDHPDGATRVDDQHFGLVLVSILGFGHRVAPSTERLRWSGPKVRLRRCGPKIRRRRRGQTPKRLRNINFNGMSILVGHADRG